MVQKPPLEEEAGNPGRKSQNRTLGRKIRGPPKTPGAHFTKGELPKRLKRAY